MKGVEAQAALYRLILALGNTMTVDGTKNEGENGERFSRDRGSFRLVSATGVKTIPSY